MGRPRGGYGGNVRRAVLLLGVVGLLSCDRATKPIVMAGHWVGSSQGLTLDLTLNESKEHVGGTGAFSAAGQSLSIAVDGTFINPNFSIRLLADGYEQAIYSGKLQGRTLTGQLNGSGFSQFDLTMAKQ
jgi:hypothetical protein